MIQISISTFFYFSVKDDLLKIYKFSTFRKSGAKYRGELREQYNSNMAAKCERNITSIWLQSVSEI
jgi:hypothetical protein